VLRGMPTELHVAHSLHGDATCAAWLAVGWIQLRQCVSATEHCRHSVAVHAVARISEVEFRQDVDWAQYLRMRHVLLHQSYTTWTTLAGNLTTQGPDTAEHMPCINWSHASCASEHIQPSMSIRGLSRAISSGLDVGRSDEHQCKAGRQCAALLLTDTGPIHSVSSVRSFSLGFSRFGDLHSERQRACLQLC
jgi:hypothetical protein